MDTDNKSLVKTDQLRDQLRQILLNNGFVEENEGEFYFHYERWGMKDQHKVRLPEKRHIDPDQWGYGREVLFRPSDDGFRTEWIINADIGHYKRFIDDGTAIHKVWENTDQQEFLTNFQSELSQMLKNA